MSVVVQKEDKGLLSIQSAHLLWIICINNQQGNVKSSRCSHVVIDVFLLRRAKPIWGHRRLVGFARVKNPHGSWQIWPLPWRQIWSQRCFYFSLTTPRSAFMVSHPGVLRWLGTRLDDIGRYLSNRIEALKNLSSRGWKLFWLKKSVHDSCRRISPKAELWPLNMSLLVSKSFLIFFSFSGWEFLTEVSEFLMKTVYTQF